MGTHRLMVLSHVQVVWTLRIFTKLAFNQSMFQYSSRTNYVQVSLKVLLGTKFKLLELVDISLAAIWSPQVHVIRELFVWDNCCETAEGKKMTNYFDQNYPISKVTMPTYTESDVTRYSLCRLWLGCKLICSHLKIHVIY